ncbi:hypothetical protein PG996_014125 [Apiospora saccharicola]|uniref:Uncharacterized protein n=1 Tax=Apiospora saccharicola TaxID=335842 RepID=A0ABR1THE5_9PEZI
MATADIDPGPPGQFQARNGYLTPPWYKEQKPSPDEMNIVSIIWGFSLACACFTFVKAIKQTWCCLYRWHRRRRREQRHRRQHHEQQNQNQNPTTTTLTLRRQASHRSSSQGQSYYTRPTPLLILNGYLAMVWAEWLVSVAFGIMSWFYLNPRLVVRGNFWVFFGFLCLWTVQMQCILQILVNRVALLMLTGSDRRCAARLRWGIAAFVGLINISCFIVWIPARLQISDRWIEANRVWDRTEKALFAVADIALNIMFVYLVRTKLIANGLHKYRRLFWTNCVAVFFSLSLDIVLIGVMSLPDDAVYLQFHPLVYLLKLHIEMNLAELLAKIVRASNELNECVGVGEGGGSSSGHGSGGQLSKAVAIDFDFDIYSSHTNTTTGQGSDHINTNTNTNTNSGEGSNNPPSYPPGVRRNNNNSNHYFDLELGLHIPPDTKDDVDSHHHSGIWRKANDEEEDRSLNHEARRLGVGAGPITADPGPTGLRGGGGGTRPSIDRHSSGSELMKTSSGGS